MTVLFSSRRSTGSPASKVPSTPVSPAGSRLACRLTTASTAPGSRRRLPRATAACLSHRRRAVGPRRGAGRGGDHGGDAGRGGDQGGFHLGGHAADALGSGGCLAGVAGVAGVAGLAGLAG